MGNAKNKISAARMALALTEPFFSTLLFKYPLREDKKILTTAMDARGQIFYNPKYVEFLTTQELIFVLCHEILHIVYQHSFRKGKRDHKLWNIACDAVINETLIALNIGIPIKSCVLYPDANQFSADKVYEKLLKDKKVKQQWYDGADIINDGDADKPIDNSDPLKDARQRFGQKLNETERKSVQISEKQNTSEALTLARLRSKGRSAAYGNFLRRVENLVMEESYPWYESLLQFMRGFVNQEQSWRRPNRRFSNVYLPTTARFPSMGKIIVGIDSSGSITEEELAFFAAHLNDIFEQCRPESITVLWCDVEICGVNEYTLDDVPIKFEPIGGGGTDMRKITQWVNENEPLADVCIIFTDGDTPFPESEKDDNVPTQWVLTTDVEVPDYLKVLRFKLD